MAYLKCVAIYTYNTSKFSLEIPDVHLTFIQFAVGSGLTYSSCSKHMWDFPGAEWKISFKICISAN